jgi:hypothetical protein
MKGEDVLSRGVTMDISLEIMNQVDNSVSVANKLRSRFPTNSTPSTNSVGERKILIPYSERPC